MKRFILVLSILLGACSQASPQTKATQALTEIPQMTESPAVTETSAPEILPAGTALPSGPVTLVALGDSLTQGDGDDSGRGGYTGRLLDMVNEVRPGSTLVNLGQSGWSSDALINGDQGIESQLTRAVAEVKSAVSQGRGAIALVWIGSNDLWYLYEYGEGTDENDAADLQRFSTNMDTILGQLNDAGAQVVFALLDDQSKRPVALKGEAFTSITSDELQRMSAHAVRYNEIIAGKAEQTGALTVDFYSTDIFTNPATLYDDGNHPNSAGYDIIAQKWFDVLSGILK
ncbi:MAG: SGNH/GDSL hydrolase family protein [Chloroflexi bacterium]|nr:SGNH/GDSL hydrolase family protein [Chloroflexota bacterium]